MNKILPLVLAIFPFSASLPAATILSQPLAFVDGRTSSLVNNTTGFITYDRITLLNSATIDRVTWIGAFIDFTTPANNPVDPAGSSWNFLVASDQGGNPGAVTDSVSLPFASITANLLGNGSLAGQPVKVYSFTAELADTLFIGGGTPQWFGIYAQTPAIDPRFGWFSGSGGDGVSKQVNLFSNSVNQYTDRALTLEGSEAPEPSTLAMLGIAGLVAGLIRRRR